ncbi:MAG TPA: immunoglobulin domain-containing protein, partial [Verrucomicrobiae bacterium]|nr:immunoglobulin domain-containing protein [Verrucomicrobiae bacterium]
ALGNDPISYQWQFSPTGAPGTATNLPGQTAANLTINNVQLINDGYYSVIAENSLGAVTSAVARLTVSTSPTITEQPASLVRVVGDSAQFSVTAAAAPGYEPISYQWRYGGTANPDPKTDIPGATAATLDLTDLQLPQQGFYSVIVSNSGGFIESADAKLTITAPGTLQKIWEILPGERTYITPYSGDAQTRDLERGLAFNPITGHLLIGARWTSPLVKGIYIVDANTGAHIGELNSVSNIITGGTIVLTRVVVADDGAIYACNFGTLSDANPLKIYRWANETAEPTLAYSGNPVSGTGLANQQWGKNMTIRGSGTGTQILMDNRNFLALFTTADGASFTPTLLQPEGLADDWNLGLTWGTNGTSFWGKASGRPLYQWAYTTGATNATLLRSYSGFPSSAFGNFSFDSKYRYLAGLTVQTGPDAVELYDISDLDRGPMLIDIGLFTSDNTQTVGYGNVHISHSRVFALNPNNGLVAFTFVPRLSIRNEGANVVISWPNTLAEYGEYVLKGTDEPTLTGGETVPHTLQGNEYQATVSPAASRKFYYLIKAP